MQCLTSHLHARPNSSIQVHEDDSLNQADSPEASESGWMQNGVKEKPPLSRFAGWVPVLLNNSTSSLAYEEMVQIVQLEFAVLRFFGFSHRIHSN